jgi:chitinase
LALLPSGFSKCLQDLSFVRKSAFVVMLRNFLSSLFFIIAISSLAQPCRQVIGYYPSWKWYNRNFLVNPSTIDYSKYSIINYAFFQPQPDGNIVPFDPYADKTLLLGNIILNAPSGYGRSYDLGAREWHTPGTSLVSLAQKNNTKVLVSIGGWTLSEHFSSIAGDSLKRATFAGSCNNLIRTYGIDGIDIDWEYPGYAQNNGKANDRENFTLLLKEIRDSLNSMQSDTTRPFLLTAAFGVAPSRIEFIEWEKVVPLLDFINLMTYDFYGSAYARTNHHAPLFQPETGIEGFNLHSVVQHLTEKFNVPSDKINIGLAFYGRSQKTNGNPDLHTSSLQIPDKETFPEDKGNPMFYSIVSRQSLFNYYWDQLAQVPFLKGKNNLNTFVSFDDEYSIAVKARYVKYYRLAGTMIWDITGDHIETEKGSGIINNTPLANILNTILCHNQPIENTYFPKSELLNILAGRPCMIIYKTYPPRLLWSPIPDKKQIKLQQKKDRKEARYRKRDKNKLPERYFNGGW